MYVGCPLAFHQLLRASATHPLLDILHEHLGSLVHCQLISSQILL